MQVVLRCNCDVQCLAWTFGEVLKKLSESKSAPGLRSAAKNIFLKTKNAHVIVFYITTYISSAKGIFEAPQKMSQVMSKKQAKMHANAATASVTSKRLERDRHVITALSQQLNRGRVLAFSDRRSGRARKTRGKKAPEKKGKTRTSDRPTYDASPG